MTVINRPTRIQFDEPYAGYGGCIHVKRGEGQWRSYPADKVEFNSRMRLKRFLYKLDWMLGRANIHRDVRARGDNQWKVTTTYLIEDRLQERT